VQIDKLAVLADNVRHAREVNDARKLNDQHRQSDERPPPIPVEMRCPSLRWSQRSPRVHASHIEPALTACKRPDQGVEIWTAGIRPEARACPRPRCAFATILKSPCP